MPVMTTADTMYPTVPYTAVLNVLGGTFKQPRQKMFGVFFKPNDNYGADYWDLVLITNDMRNSDYFSMISCRFKSFDKLVDFYKGYKV